MSDLVILSAARTPYARAMGAFADVTAENLAAHAIRGAIDRSGIAAGEIERIILGNAAAFALRGNPAGAAATAAGLPNTCRPVTVRSGCASGLAAIVAAAESIQAGSCRIAAAGGFESASTTPHFVHGLRRGLRLGAGMLLDAARHDGPAPTTARGENASPEARHVEWARSGIVPVEIPGTKKGASRAIEMDDAVEAKASNPPGDPDGVSPPPLADGAAVVVVASRAWALERSLNPVARLSIISQPKAEDFLRCRFIESDAPGAADDRSVPPIPETKSGDVNTAGDRARHGHATGADGATLVVNLVGLLTGAGGGTGLAVAAGGWGETVWIQIEV